MANSVDLQTIDRGLGALKGLLQNADVRAMVAVFRADFEAASQQIDVLSDYKDLHDLLHRLQFECHGPIERQAASFPQVEDVVQAFSDHELTFQGIVSSLREVGGRPTVARELTWIARLAEAATPLQQAIESKDPAALKRYCQLVKRVLDTYPSLVNERLNAAARAIRMDAVDHAMTTILEILKKHATASTEATSFAAGAMSLSELNRSLSCLVHDHDLWQDVDRELRRLEAALRDDPEEFELSWPHVRAFVTPLMVGEKTSWSQTLLYEGNELDGALATKDLAMIQQHFRRFQRQAADRFFRVDGELKSLCSQLRKLAAPLAAAAQLIAPVIPVQSAPLTESEPSAGAAPHREHRLRELAELSRRYDALNGQISALDEDIGRTLDSEQRLILERRRAERAAERDQIVERRVQLEIQLTHATGQHDQVSSADREV